MSVIWPRGGAQFKLRHNSTSRLTCLAWTFISHVKSTHGVLLSRVYTSPLQLVKRTRRLAASKTDLAEDHSISKPSRLRRHDGTSYREDHRLSHGRTPCRLWRNAYSFDPIYQTLCSVRVRQFLQPRLRYWRQYRSWSAGSELLRPFDDSERALCWKHQLLG
jgi:hypothetical protein